MKETKVYAIDLDSYEMDIFSLTDEQFIAEAKKEGLVWSLKGFEAAFNGEEISYEWFIRII